MRYDSSDAPQQRLTIRFRTPDGAEYATPPNSLAPDDQQRAALERYAQCFGNAGLELLRALHAPIQDTTISDEQIYALFGLHSYNA